MLLSNLTAAISFLTFSTLISACPSPPDKLGTNSSMAFQVGTDGPADPATTGYTMNHFAMIVNDISATRHFYGDILGMRHIFTFQATPEYSITYMGYSSGGKNGTGYQTGEEMLSEKNNREGLIEFLCLSKASGTASDTVPPTTKARNTFSHVGLIVPNIMQAQQRLESFGVEIVKGVGNNLSPNGGVPQAYGLGEDAMEDEAVSQGINAIGFEKFLLVTDPDGNLVEIQQQS